MRKLGLSLVAFLALAAVVGFLATGGLSMSSNDSSAGGNAGTSVPERAAAGPASRDDVGSVAVGGGGSAGGSLGSIGGLPAIGPAVVRNATLTVQVSRGTFDDAFSRARQIAGRYGGYVESSSTSGTRVHSGSLTIRVPSSSFEDAMTVLSDLGVVQAQSESGRDVTNDYVDLNARLRTWQTQEVVLLRLLRDANSIEETLRVQSNLQDVQFRIEQIKGQLRVLENQTDLGTIDMTMHEPGAAVPLRTRPNADERPSLTEAWTRAVNGFLGVLYATVVGLGYLVPIAAIGAAIWFAVRRLRPATS
jgi:Domain of unknown function (DUF4349)